MLRERIASGMQPVVVHSALSGITDRLESLLSAGVAQRPQVLERIEAGHRDLATRLGMPAGPRFEGFLRELKDLAASLPATGATADGLRARIMALGELLATSLGAEFLNAQGISTAWIDARHVLRAERRDNATAKAGLLSATCDFAPDAPLQSAWGALQQVVITQGFIAANEHGDTVLLGRGGSDTSAAYFAAKLRAVRLEIWTDVPGMFSAIPAPCRARGCCGPCTTTRPRRSRATAPRFCIRAA